MRKDVHFLIRLVPFIIEVIHGNGSHQLRKVRVTFLSESSRKESHVLGSVVVQILLRLARKVSKELKEAN
jgi:hypothetical protein